MGFRVDTALDPQVIEDRWRSAVICGMNQRPLYSKSLGDKEEPGKGPEKVRGKPGRGWYPRSQVRVI